MNIVVLFVVTFPSDNLREKRSVPQTKHKVWHVLKILAALLFKITEKGCCDIMVLVFNSPAFDEPHRIKTVGGMQH